jgi:hypothetical protein
MAECRIITQRVGRPLMRLINRRAHAMGGNEYFEDCRAYVLQKVELELRRQDATLSVDWLQRVLETATIDDMRNMRSSTL